MVTDGFGAPYIRLFYKKEELTSHVERFVYTEDEEDDDEINIVVRLEKREEVDAPKYQEKTELELIWGYIGGETSKTRKVYIRSANPSFEKEGIILTLECTEKGSVLKNSADKKIYKGDTFLGAVASKAVKHDLGMRIEVPNDAETFKIIGKPGESQEEFDRRWLEAYYKHQAAGVRQQIFDKAMKNAKDPNYKPPPNTTLVQIDPRSFKKDTKVSVNTNLTGGQLYNKYYKTGGGTPNVPQANKSDLQFIKQWSKKVIGGGVVVETRDDNITVRRRNLNQTPYRSYEYGSSNGELISFVAETKNRSKGSTGTSVGFTGWTPKNKSIFTGAASGQNDPSGNDPGLSNALKIIEELKRRQARGGGLSEVERRDKSGKALGAKPTFIPAPFAYPNQEGFTGQIYGPGKSVMITVNESLEVLTKAVAAHQARVKSQMEEQFGPKPAYSAATNPSSAYTQAANRRRNAELETNPATLQVWGDPKLKVGIIVTVLNVGKKHSGNYYVKRCTHSIDKYSGFLNELELRKTGHNIKTNDNYVPTKQTKRDVNKQVGPDQGNKATKKLKVQTNEKKR